MPFTTSNMSPLAFSDNMNHSLSDFIYCRRLYNEKVESILLESKSLNEGIYSTFFIEKQFVGPMQGQRRTFFSTRPKIYCLCNSYLISWKLYSKNCWYDSRSQWSHLESCSTLALVSFFLIKLFFSFSKTAKSKIRNLFHLSA